MALDYYKLVNGIKDDEEKLDTTTKTESNNSVSFKDLSLRDKLKFGYSSLMHDETYSQREQAREAAEYEISQINKKYGNNRNELTNIYTDYVSRRSDNAIDNYRNSLIAQSIADKLRKDSNFLTNVGDFGEGVYLGAKGFVASNIGNAKQASMNVAGILGEDLNYRKLYDIAKGKVSKNDAEYAKLTELYNKYGNNEKVADLYHYVNDGKGVTLMEVSRLTDYANNLRKTSEYNAWRNAYTVDDDYDISRFSLKNELSYDDGLGKAMNSAAPVIGDILIPAMLGASVGNVVGSTKAISGMKAAGEVAKANNIIQRVNQGVTLASMYTGVKGSAFNRALQDGATWNEAELYSNLDAALEVGTELIGGEKVNALLGRVTGTTPIGRLTSKFINRANIKNDIAKLMIGWVSNVGAEATEEMISAVFEPIIAAGTYGKNIDSPGDYISNIFKSGLESIIPTLIMSGFGQARINTTINKIQQQMTYTITEDPRVAVHLTDTEKTELLNKLEVISKNAKLGIEENYDELSSAVKEEAKAKGYEEQLYEIENSLKSKVKTNLNRLNNLSSIYRQDENGNYVMTADERASALDFLSNNNRLPTMNGTYKTSQELADASKVSNITYKNTEAINAELETLKNQNPNIQNIEVVNELSKIDENIKSLIDYYIDGETVFVNPTTTGETDYGFTNPRGTKNVYIDANQSTKDKIATAWHEIAHQVKISNPELYDEFIEKAKISDDAIKRYNDQLTVPKTRDEVLEEMFGDYLGKELSSAENSSKFENSTTGPIKMIKELSNRIANKVAGSEVDNSRVSVYNLDVASYLDNDILTDKAFEDKVFKTMQSLKSKPRTQTTKTVQKPAQTATQNVGETPESGSQNVGDTVKSRIEERYKQFDKKLVNMKSVKEMIAEELGTNYNDPQVDKIYKELKEYGNIGERIKLSSRKTKTPITDRQYATVAPYRNVSVTEENYEEMKNRVAKKFLKNADRIAGELGIKVEDVYSNMGGFLSSAGKFAGQFVNEVSFTFDLGNVPSNQADLFASLLGDLGHEMQEAVISANYLEEDSKEGDALEVKIHIKNLGGVAEALDRVNIKDYTIDRTNKVVKLIMADWSSINPKNINKFAKELGDNYAGKEGTKIESRYIDRGARQGIYKEWLRTNKDSESNRKLRNDVTKALELVTKELDETKNSKQGSFSMPEDTKYSSRKTESNTEKIVNNQRDEIERQRRKIEELAAENKGLKNINKGIKFTGRQQIRNIQSESNKMLKTGREQELKMKGQLERAGKKYNRLSQIALDIKYEEQLERKSRADGINFPREYKDLFVGLRNTKMSIQEAYDLTKDIYEESQVINKSIDNSISILSELRKRKVYNKLPNDIKEKIDKYSNIWAGSRQQSDLTLAKRVLNSLTARELREVGVNLTNSVRNQIMSEEGYGWENGKGSKSLQELFNGSKEVAQAFEQELLKLRQEVAEFQARNMLEERAKQLADTIETMQDEVSRALEKKGTIKLKTLKTNKTLANSLMTLKTEIQALMSGNGNTKMMVLNDNLQKGEIRKKQAIVEVYRILSTFMQRSSGINYALNTQRWSPSLEKSLSNKSKFVDTGMVAYDDKGKKVNIKLPRSMMMSLAMHLLNQDNMAHISGAATKITTDDSGNTHIEYAKGKGVRIPNEALFRAGNEKDAYDTGVTVRLLEDQVEAIANMLTDEEKAFVKAVGEVFKYTSELINEVSNRIVGYDMATVENYFPIHVWDKGETKGSVMKAPPDKSMKAYGDALAYMLNPGWLQERVTSFNPIYLENIAEVMNRVVNNVTNFYGYAEALRDNHIILDSIMPDKTEFSKNIDDLSSSFLSNYTKLTRFITGQETLKDSRLRSLMAMNTLTFNIGTWLTQPMSFFNTIKYFSGKEFLSAINPVNNNIKLNKMIRKYFDDMGIDHGDYDDYQVARAFIAMATPNLDYRALGYKIPELNQLFSKGLQEKIGAHGIQAFDDIAVTAIARMMAYSVSLDPNIEFGSEEYFDVLGERLTQVLVETQPEYSHVNRSNMFRSTDPVLRALSLFGTPANQMFNNFMQAAMQVRYEASEGKVSKKSAVNLVKSASGVILSSVLVGLIRALRDKVRDGDDDDTKFADRFIAQSVIAVLSPTLILDDVAQFVMSHSNYGGMSSYDFNTPETTYVNGFWNLGEKILQLADDDVSPARKTKDIARAIGIITPVDTKSIVRVTEALMKFAAPNLYKSYSLQTNSTIYKQWLKNSDTDMATFYTAYTATRESVLKEKYGYHKADKDKKIKSNLKECREKALMDVLGSKKEVDEYMEILFGYKN